MLHRLWPLPALLAWGAAWAAYLGAARTVPLPWALAAGCAASAALSPLGGRSWWRRGLVAAGFPLSLAILGGGLALIPAWVWLVALGLLLLVYPVHAWRDAPLFPTPPGALDGLPAVAPLPPGAAVLDAGCGLGDGLRALRRAYPQARLHGIEGSWPLRWLCALRCPWARVRHGDLWRADWSGHALVYLFQRPESMKRAWQKASREMAAGGWLVSLEFEAAGRQPQARGMLAGGRPVWVYRIAAQAPAPDASGM
ncbi:class I SAM-dependent methyltransferase [Xylophilus sp.]|uniref:class I SAM-dependent methyltransferase n=1 Tax=Xylophilus sp. TaxID=2653893 RepID=UPI0013BE2497|nr:class I SAM-dependent methyltransferase [Xylophilus sp.]KAF1050174.1 MAG: hypothetical protein GAK38_00200 [Xylophilus sp.]